MQTATVVTEGQSQSIRLPEGFHIDSQEVYVKQVGQTILLIPKEANLWDVWKENLNQFTEDFMQDRAQPLNQDREAPFD